MNPPHRRFRRASFALLTVLAACLLFEGLCSFLLLAGAIRSAPPPDAEKGHTRYDPDLGWSSKPGAWIPNLYGPGIAIQINSQGFRSDRDFPPAAPADRLRAICSGDSFTFGHGVGNRETWCEQLAVLDPRLEPVNMGQGAYGVDQAYLWYMRDGVPLEHGLHIFAFITDNLVRMQRDEFNGYGKPVLRASGGRIEVGNVPVPRRSEARLWLEQKAEQLGQLRSIQLLRAIQVRLFPSGVRRPRATALDDTEAREVLPAIFAALHAANARKGSLLLLVHLPVKNEVRADGLWRDWKDLVRAESARQGIPFFDLSDEFRKLLPKDLDTMFLTPRGGHYSVRGNRFVAEKLHQRLLALPAAAGKLPPASRTGP